ncbi:MAG TPA: transcription-repair coupling factor [Thermoanaerobaculia bacterium]|jgi:transcription-repair coupling factor (superfamily II helicase)
MKLLTHPLDVIAEDWRAASREILASAPYQALAERLGEVVRLPAAAAAWVLELLAAELGRPLLVVAAHESDAYAWLEAARLVAGAAAEERCVYFPAPSLSVYQEAEVSLAVRAAEAVALRRLVDGEASTVITTPRALFRRLPRAADFAPAVRHIAAGEEQAVDDLARHLVKWGYRRADLVFEVGQFAVRGGVFDFFPPGEPSPVRLDLFGDTVESIRAFEPESQRSEESLEAVEALPLSLFPQGEEAARRLADLLVARIGAHKLGDDAAGRVEALRGEGRFDGWEHYLPLLAAETVTLTELLPEALVVTLDRDALAADVEHHAEVLAAEYEARVIRERLALPPAELEVGPAAVRAILERAEVRLGDLLVPRQGAVDFAAGLTDVFHDQLPRLPREIETARGRGDRVLVVAPDDHRPRLAEMLASLGVEVGRGGVELVAGELERGFRLPAAGLTVFGERQILRRAPLVRRGRRGGRFGPFLASLRDLKVGDYVVHGDHGIGQFVGLRTLGASAADLEGLPPALASAAPKGDDGGTEVMEIVYAGGKRLLLPLARLDQVQKYSGIEGLAPRLDRLGGASWNRTKSRIKRGLRDMAEELLKLYAERRLARAPEIPTDEGSELRRQFDAAFEYEETPDQLAAIAAIEGDLARAQPMDRLLCGDVGFGKTEIAMRAAMTVVEGGYQVAVLAPTTILADQHLETFRRRFGNLPVRVDMISRFRSAAEVREIQRRTEAGEVDVLIGTHRLLTRAIDFPRLGLVIIDEEQRFGVAHKERLKQLRKDVHVLAMSATPVPRTLQLSLAGVRDLSLIETPPRDRMAVETAILPFDAELVREALEFEIGRGGQVYYVYNRVETIERMASYLREAVPGLTLTVGHGQLEEAELSRRMHAFTAGDYQLLLATTIIENGIDIPNVNTMIVHRADRFGLAQLYQLRGRVGRSDQLAYCYLLVPGDQVLTPEARKRLDAIREFSELGAGFRVAGRDLEIRGAGNLLGAEQSGHISAVGIETYLNLLEETVAELKGERREEAPSVLLDLPIATSIPPEYVGDANLRMEIYRRLAAGEETEEALLGELRDRFGPPPEGVRTLLEAAAVKRMAEALRLQSITAKGGRLVFRLRQDARVDPGRLIALVERHPSSRFSPSGALTLEGVRASEALARARETLAYLAAAA